MSAAELSQERPRVAVSPAWFVWRQHRRAVGLHLAACATVGAVLIVYRLLVANALDRQGLGGCVGHADVCGHQMVQGIASAYGWIGSALILALLILPILSGATLGGSLFAPDMESGLVVLALTQSVSRRSWFLAKVCLVAVPAGVGVAFLGVLSYWASRAVVSFSTRDMITPGFETRGVAVVGYFLVAMAAACLIGSVRRNTAAGIAGGIAAAGLIVLTIGGLLRPHFVTPEVQTQALGPPPGADSSWITADDWEISSQYIDRQGQSVTIYQANCAEISTTECLRNAGVVAERVEFQPASRFWLFQLIEASITTMVAILVFAASWRCLRSPRALGVRH